MRVVLLIGFVLGTYCAMSQDSPKKEQDTASFLSKEFFRDKYPSEQIITYDKSPLGMQDWRIEANATVIDYAMLVKRPEFVPKMPISPGDTNLLYTMPIKKLNAH